MLAATRLLLLLLLLLLGLGLLLLLLKEDFNLHALLADVDVVVGASPRSFIQLPLCDAHEAFGRVVELVAIPSKVFEFV